MNPNFDVVKWRRRCISGFIIGLLAAFLALVINLITGDRLWGATIFLNAGLAFFLLTVAAILIVLFPDNDGKKRP